MQCVKKHRQKLGLFFTFLLFFFIADSAVAGKKSKPRYLSLTYEEILSDTLSVPLEQIYLDRMYAASDSVFQTEFEAEFLLILSKKQKEEYLSLPTLLDKKDFIARYWRAYNPNPLLEQNDRLLDHIRRVAYARKNFPSYHPPYIDDRGKYYIKYGEPSVRYVDPGGIRRIALFSPGLYEQIERYYTMGTAPLQLYSVPANETWGYENVSRNFVVHFVWKGQEFKEIKSLAEIIRSGKRSNIAWQWSDLLKRRASVSPILGEAAAQVESFEVELLHMAFSGGDGFTGERVSTGTAHEKMINRLESSEEELLKFRQYVPPASYDPIRAVNRLKFTGTVTQFRGTDGKTRLKVHMLAPIHKNLLPAGDTRLDTLRLEFGAMLRDRLFSVLDSSLSWQRFPIYAAKDLGLPFAVGQLVLEAPPQKTELTLHLRDYATGQLGFQKKIIRLRDFNSPFLEMSDIELYAPLPSEQVRDILPVVTINQIDLIPYPSESVSREVPLYCYFEIYNLQTSGISGNYEIAYKISSERKSQTIFQKISRMFSTDKDVSISLKHAQPIYQNMSQELIALDLSQLEPGNYTLEITVSDAGDPKISVSETREIVIEN